MQRKEVLPTMATDLGRIADKARSEPKLRFTSLAHHLTRERVWESLSHIPRGSAPGIDGIGVEAAKRGFKEWVETLITSIHHQGYPAPAVRRVWIPKPGKTTKRPLGVPCVADRALQRATAQVLGALYEQDFLPCSFGGRPGKSAHQAIATLHCAAVDHGVGWVLEADLKNFFGSLDHGGLLRFVEHRVGDPRILSLIRRWLKAGVLEDGVIKGNDLGTPQGGSISVLLSNVYLHYVLDLWFEKAVRPMLKGKAHLIRYIDDFMVMFQNEEEARHFQEMLKQRLAKFGLELEPEKTRLVPFGKAAYRTSKRTGKKAGTLYFLGFTHYCTQTRKGLFTVGRRTEKSRLRRSIAALRRETLAMRHHPLKDQAERINPMLRGHFAYYGVAGNNPALNRCRFAALRQWRIALSQRSRKSNVNWETYRKILGKWPILPTRIHLPFGKLRAMAVLRI